MVLLDRQSDANVHIQDGKSDVFTNEVQLRSRMVRPVKHNAFLGSLRCPVYGRVRACSASLAEMGGMEVETVVYLVECCAVSVRDCELYPHGNE